MLCFSSYTMYSVFTTQRLSNNNNDKFKYKILFLNASTKAQNVREISCHPALMEMYVEHEMLWARGRCLVRRIRT